MYEIYESLFSILKKLPFCNSKREFFIQKRIETIIILFFFAHVSLCFLSKVCLQPAASSSHTDHTLRKDDPPSPETEDLWNVLRPFLP